MSFSANHLTPSLLRARDVLPSSHCHLLLLILLLPSSLAQRVETKQGPIIGQRWRHRCFKEMAMRQPKSLATVFLCAFFFQKLFFIDLKNKCCLTREDFWFLFSRTYSNDFRYNVSVAYDSFYSLPFASPPLGKPWRNVTWKGKNQPCYVLAQLVIVFILRLKLNKTSSQASKLR